MRMWCAKPVGATHHGRLHNAKATEWREGLDRPGRGHPDLAGIYQPRNMTIDAREKKTDQKKKAALRSTMSPERVALLQNLLTRESSRKNIISVSISSARYSRKVNISLISWLNCGIKPKSVTEEQCCVKC